VLQLLPATAATLSKALRRAVEQRDFMEPAEMLTAKRGLHMLLGAQPMTVERGESGRAQLRIGMDPGAVFTAASGNRQCGSGGVIRNYRNLNYHEIFFDGESSP